MHKTGPPKLIHNSIHAKKYRSHIEDFSFQDLKVVSQQRFTEVMWDDQAGFSVYITYDTVESGTVFDMLFKFMQLANA